MKQKTPRKWRPPSLLQRYTRMLPALSDGAFIKVSRVYERLAKERPHSSVQQLFFAAVAEAHREKEASGEDDTAR